MIVIVRLRGEAGTNWKVNDTFDILGMKKINSVALVENTPVIMGMIKKINNFAAWGEASPETVEALGNTRNLKSPRGGLKSKKLHYPRGNLGYNGDKINDLVRKMI